MAHHIIRVTLVDSGTADTLQSLNPVTTVPGDTVEWIFTDAAGSPQNLRIEFAGFMPTQRPGPPISGPGKHPFVAPPPATTPTSGSFTVANTDRGIYYYGIFREAQEIKWAAPLFQVRSFNAFFGGIIIRDPPGGP